MLPIAPVPGAPEGKVVKGEHIFPATVIEPMAVRWKELNAAKRFVEAGELLEDIVIKSTAMFMRLAQYEGFQHTVDLDSLVLAAQARVANWLLYWDPKKGRLFSWLSKSLAGDSKVLLSDFTWKTIKEIVDGKLQVEVLSLNEKTGLLEPKPIINWIISAANLPPSGRRLKRPIDGNDLWRILTVKVDKDHSGNKTAVTGDHQVYTGRGWVEVDYLTPEDSLYKIRYDGSALVAVKTTSWSVRPANPGDVKTFGHLGAKYDITVADNFNFICSGVVVHNCAKHVFLSEVARASQHKKRYYATGDNLEKFVGSEDHGVAKNEAAGAMREMLIDLSCRWGDEQSISCIRYHIECVISSAKINKKAVILGGAYASGLTPELSKFFYNWALFALRDAMFDKLNLPYSEEDLFRLGQSYTFLPDLLTIITWKQMLKMIALMGGQRLKIPTIAQVDKFREDYKTYLEIQRTGVDPESIAKAAKARKINPLPAEEIYRKMTMETNSDRAGDYSLYD